MKKRTLVPVLSLMALGAAVAQTVDPSQVSYDPSVLAKSFAALAALVLVATQFVKQHVLAELLAKDADGKFTKWASIATCFVLALGGAFALQFLFGGITDPLLAVVALPWLKSLTFGALAGLSAAGFHGLASGIAKNLGKAVGIAVALAQGRKGDAVTELLKLLMSGSLWEMAKGAAQANAELDTRATAASVEERIASKQNMDKVVGQLEVAALEAARTASLSKEDTARLIESLRKETVNLGLKSTYTRATF